MNRLLIAALCLTAASAFAQTNTPRVDQREANQQAPHCARRRQWRPDTARDPAS